MIYSPKTKFTHRIGRYMGDNSDPRTINYTTGLQVMLDAERTFVKGELVRVTHKYRGEPLIQVDVTYDPRDAHGRTTGRDTQRRWFLANGELDARTAKYSRKNYTPLEQQREAVRRRTNIVDNLLAEANELGLSEQIQAVFSTLTAEVQEYLTTGSTTLIAKMKHITPLQELLPVGELTVYEYLQTKLGE